MADEKKGIFNEFQAFVLRGNVVDLAVGVVIGAAFGRVITSLVEDVLTPLTGLLRVPDFKNLQIDLGPSTVDYGLFLNALLAFLLVSAAIFFFVVKPLNRLMESRKTEPDVVSTTKECPRCLSNVPEAASRCAFCTSELTAAT